MKRLVLAALAASTALAGCTAVGPSYHEPVMALAPTFSEGSAQRIGEVAGRRWWRDYNDPMLTALVERGLAQNLDIAAAQERIRASKAALRQTGLAAAADGGATSESIRSGSDSAAVSTSASTTLDADFVIDLFGGIRRAREAAVANLGAAEADVGTERLAYLTSILGAYLDARYYQESLALTRQTIASRQQTLNITQNQRATGAATELDEVQVQALLDDARSDLPGLEASFLANVYAIATLLGEPAQPLVGQMTAGAPQPRPRGNTATGVPADLVRNRPDVRSAERSLAAAVANVGVSTAAMLPSVTLTGSISAGGGNPWTFGPTLTQAVFNQPALKAARDASVSEARQAEIAWRQAVLGAVEDVQTANSQRLRDGQTVSLLQRAENSYQRALDLSRQNYEAGALSLLDLLDADRSLATAQTSLASAVRTQAVDYATLQIALGAGAYPAAPPAPGSVPSQ